MNTLSTFTSPPSSDYFRHIAEQESAAPSAKVLYMSILLHVYSTLLADFRQILVGQSYTAVPSKLALGVQ